MSKRRNDDGARPSLREAIALSKLTPRPATEADRPHRRGVKPNLIPGQLSIDDLPDKDGK
jgi:hypothetical protein